jgi:hypothetical protein
MVRHGGGDVAGVTCEEGAAAENHGSQPRPVGAAVPGCYYYFFVKPVFLFFCKKNKKIGFYIKR